MRSTESWYNRSLSFYELENYEESVVSFQKAIDCQPDDYEAWNHCGSSLSKLGRYDEAITSYDKAIAIKSDDHWVWNSRGIALENLERYEEAIESYDKAINIKPDYYWAWDNRGDSLKKLERYEEAITSYDEVLEIKPDSHWAWNNRGIALAHLGRDEEALTSFNKAIEIRSDYYTAWHGRGYAQSLLGYYEEAIESFDKAIIFKPDDCEIWYSRAVCLLKLGHNKEAIRSLDKAIEIKPDYYEAWNTRGLLLTTSSLLGELLDKARTASSGRIKAWMIIRKVTAVELAKKLPAWWEKVQPRGLDELRMLGNMDLPPLSSIARDLTRKTEDSLREIQSVDNKSNETVRISLIMRDAYANLYDKLVVKVSESDFAIDQDMHTYKFARQDEVISLCDFDVIDTYMTRLKRFLNEKNDSTTLWRLMAYISEGQDKKYDALEYWEKVIQQKSNDYEAWYQKAHLLYWLGKKEKAIACCERALEIRKDDAWVWIKKASALNNIGKNREAIITCLEGLKYVHRDKHPESWGWLHHRLGIEYAILGQYASGELGFGELWIYACSGEPKVPLQSKIKHNQFNKFKSYYYQASMHLEQSVAIFVSHKSFYRLGMTAIDDLVKIYECLGSVQDTRRIRLKGLEVFRNLFNEAKNNLRRSKLEEKFLAFSFQSVEILIQDRCYATALETAERYKNRALSWILDHWQESILSPSYTEIRLKLMQGNTIVYWHQSDDAITTFILDSNESLIVLDCDRYQQYKRFIAWKDKWDNDYEEYRSKKSFSQSDHPWRQKMRDRLKQLKEILQIEKIEQHLNNAEILILIPHRDLHRYPIHSLFDRAITHAPSLQALTRPENPTDRPSLLTIADPETAADPMPYARLESAILHSLLQSTHPTAPITPISPDRADRPTVLQTLQTHHTHFHFTGHAIHDAQFPNRSALQLKQDSLTANTIAQLNLNHLNLAILAACETAIVNPDDTSDYIGLQSAFLRAGTRTILSTLWNINEIASTWFTVHFYQQILKGIQPSIALTQTQTWMKTLTWEALYTWLESLTDLTPYRWKKELQQAIDDLRKEQGKLETIRTPYAHPYYWAAFTIVGQA